MQLELDKNYKIVNKVWSLKQIVNCSEPGSVGPDEMGYIFSGWGDHDIFLTEEDIDKLIADGQFK